MNGLPISDAQDRTNLLDRIAELEYQLAEARATILKLTAQIEELQRAGKRQAVPFARRERVENPKQPGRKRHKGVFKNRERPDEKEVDTTKKAELSDCPECHCDLVELKEHEQFEIDIPVVKPIITRYVMLSGKCPQCVNGTGCIIQIKSHLPQARQGWWSGRARKLLPPT